MCRYGDLTYFNSLPLKLGNKMVAKILEDKNNELEKQIIDKEWDMWISLYPNMNKNTFVSFSDFRGKLQSKETISKKSTMEILQETAYIKNKVQNGEIDKVRSEKWKGGITD